MPESVLTHTMPLLFAGGACSVAALGGVRALVVLPELAAAVGDLGVVSASALVGVGFAAPFDSGVLALVVLPELTDAVGFLAAAPSEGGEAAVDSFAAADFDLRLFADVVFFSVAAESAAGVVAAAVESEGSLFFVLLLVVFFSAVAEPASDLALALESNFVSFFDLGFAVEAVPSASAESAGFFFDFFALVEGVAVLSVSAAVAESAFFLVAVFFDVVDLSVVLGVAVESVASAAGFFFLVFFLAVESVWV